MKKSEEGTRKNIWFTSDQHYGHKNIIRFCNRPFADIDEHDEALIENYNACVQPGDTVYLLGDFCLGANPDSIFNRLNGNKHLILGNHDREKKLKHLPWAWIKRIYELKIDRKTLIVLCHFAMRRWNKSHHGSIHLYGHSHGSLEDYGKSTDVGVDAWDYKPVHLDTILEMMKGRTKTDHH